MKKSKYTKEVLEEAVKNSTSWGNLLTTLGRKQSGGMHRLITQKVNAFKINTDHFTGCAWNKGLTRETSEALNKAATKNSLLDSDIFCENSTYSCSKLYKRLLRKGIENKCVNCGINTWDGNPLRLHVDHINGKHYDNRIENLRLLCPNCHSQTSTYGSKNGRVAQRPRQ